MLGFSLVCFDVAKLPERMEDRKQRKKPCQLRVGGLFIRGLFPVGHLKADYCYHDHADQKGHRDQAVPLKLGVAGFH
jgi:hypothetical protein